MKSATLALALFASIAASTEVKLNAIDRNLTPHFSAWLKANGYGDMKFERTDLVGGAYGGKTSDSDEIKHYPIIMFHGNSDIAVGTSTYDYFTGFTKNIEYFLSKGYTKAELYITTWGPGNKLMASQQTHNQDYLVRLRKFTEAVLAYTGAEKINVIGHSMGVTLGRRVIKGGLVKGAPTAFDLGPSLAGKVDTFIGIAGANYGLINCAMISIIPTCNDVNGFYPGSYLGTGGASKYLAELNNDPIKEGAHVFSIFSTSDDLIGYGDVVYGKYTSMWPTVDESKIFTFQISCHMKLRDETVAEQYNLITNHKFTSTAALE